MVGSIPPNSLSRLSALQILSLRSNHISGLFPYDLLKLENLTMLSLQSNNFHGPLPASLSVWRSIYALNLSNNAFNGSIPSSITDLTHLTVLNLANNTFSGDIPDLNLPSLQILNLSHNNLTGNVPQSLDRFPNSAFAGNQLSRDILFTPAPSVLPPGFLSNKKSKKLGGYVLLGITIGVCGLGFVVISVLLVLSCSRKEDDNGIPAKPLKRDESLCKVAYRKTRNERGNVVFFDGCNLSFDLEDLLRASAEIIGKGAFGTTYKVALEDATTVVVKRLKEVSVRKREFVQQMEAIGNIKHENVVPLRAYYYSKDDKLIVHDHYSRGSVFSMLHSKRGEGWIPLDWETRVRIAIGAARGIAYIHGQHRRMFVHGNIKSSNIFLNSEQYGCISDLGLAKLINPIDHPPIIRTAGYHPPDSRKVTQESDVYNFGVFLLEVLTRKCPAYTTCGNNEVVDLVRWVHSVVRQEWTVEVFDVELLKCPNIEEEMVEMLQIGMCCVARIPVQRPNMSDVVTMMEGIGRMNTGTQPSTENSTPVLTPPMADIKSSYPH
ncbi:unnamed protein product [Cuscuta epithymum]|uniref:Protein kinase domain-containing protein n=1 Tax=Cuscuta epithymum TaxID=186058 RepID=A0AAV0CBG0_9ASTE|nr:unnamed protein product [Cuscuta epithymum]